MFCAVSEAPKIFVSINGSDLRSVRMAVKKELSRLGCVPVERDRDSDGKEKQTGEIQRIISECAGMVHVAGVCAGPLLPREAGAEQSYAQFEYETAWAENRSIHVFLCADYFPFDPHETEEDEVRRLQRSHREKLMSGGRHFSTVEDAPALLRRIGRLPVGRQKKSGRIKRWLMVGAAVLLLAGIGGGAYWWHQSSLKTVAIRRAGGLEKVRTFLWRLAGDTAAWMHPGEVLTVDQRFRRAAERLAQENQLSPEQFQEALKAFVARVRADKRSTFPDLALAEFAEKQFGRAEAQARATANLERGTGGNASRRRDALLLMGDAQMAQEEFSEASQGYQEAAMLIPEKPLEPWVAAQRRLAWSLWAQGRVPESLALWRKILAAQEAHGAAGSADEARTLGWIAALTQRTGERAEAERSFRRAIEIGEKTLGAENAEVGMWINNLGGLLQDAGRLDEAETLYRRALAIAEKSSGVEHSDVAVRLNNLAGLLQQGGKMVEAEDCFRRALEVDLKALGPEHAHIARRLNNLALFLKSQGRLGEAEPLYRRALAVAESASGPEDVTVAMYANNLALMLQQATRLEEAEPFFRQAVAISEKVQGRDHPDLAAWLNNLGSLLRQMGRIPEAEPMLDQALAIRQKVFGPRHWVTANSLLSLSQLRAAQKRFPEATDLCQQAIAVDEATLGPNHPATKNAQSYLNELKRAAFRAGQ